MYSKTALLLYTAKKAGIIKSNASFWRDFNNIDKLNSLNLNTEMEESHLKENAINLTCVFDDNFPSTPSGLKPSEKPYLFAYKGDISLLKDRTKNMAVVGTLTPDGNIIAREKEIIKKIVDMGFYVVSGLALGCDTVAHSETLAVNGKTIAFLPSALENIYPKSNKKLVDSILSSGGLVITEYINEPLNRYQSVSRFIERDRLQALFAANIILIASSLPGKGDSGSRHAMAKAKDYNTNRFVMYNETTDNDNPLFGLNRQLAESGVSILTANELKNL